MNNVWMVLLFLGIPLIAESYGQYGGTGHGRQMKLVSEWKSVEFNFPTVLHLQASIALGENVPGNAVPLDVDVHYQGFSKILTLNSQE